MNTVHTAINVVCSVIAGVSIALLLLAHGPAGARGPAGPRGSTGPAGASGTSAPVLSYTCQLDFPDQSHGGTITTFYFPCTPDKSQG